MAIPHPGYHPPQRTSFSVTDLVLTPVLIATLLLACAGGFVYSGFAVMATDGCGGTPERCDYGLINTSYVITLGGIAAALLIAVIGIAIAAAKRTPMYIWPSVGLAILVAAMVIGALTLSSGVGG
ncbi:MAG TPA: hypothetical protein VHT50_09285 [Mycobacterium sp.]|jgi:hypothetical protein|nr:hypothetical protein [Mycobacterium sp.]